MNIIQDKLNELKAKGWTLASIARAIGQSHRTIESWNQGKRSPANLKSVLVSLDNLDKAKRIPKKKLYPKDSRKMVTTNPIVYERNFDKPIDK